MEINKLNTPLGANVYETSEVEQVTKKKILNKDILLKQLAEITADLKLIEDYEKSKTG